MSPEFGIKKINKDNLYERPIQPTVKPPSLQERLASVGFNVGYDKLYFIGDTHWLRNTPYDRLKYISDLLVTDEMRDRFIQSAAVRDDSYGTLLIGALDKLRTKFETEPHAEDVLRDYFRKVQEFHTTSLRDRNILGEVAVGVEILNRPKIFEMLGQNLDNLFEYAYILSRRKGSAVVLLDEFNMLEGNDKLRALFGGGNTSTLASVTRLVNMRDFQSYDLRTMVAVREHAIGQMDWAGRVLAARDIFAAEGLDISDLHTPGSLELERIHKRENRLHPLNSSGISATVGFEIEYDSDNPAVVRMKGANVERALKLIGYDFGTGGSESDEISPGPFYDSATATAVYDIFSDAGVINTLRNYGFTLHFNVGIDTSDVDGKSQQIINLLRGMYLTGAMNNPHRRYKNGELMIIPRGGIKGDYTECKAFEIYDDEQFRWGFDAAARLSWAAKAHKEMGENPKGVKKWKTELASLWNEYVERMQAGLESIGFGGYLGELSNRNNMVTDVIEQMKRIYREETLTILPDLRSVGQTSPDIVDCDGIEGVEAGGNWWPNIAIYARGVTDNIVQRIKEVGRAVEEECISDMVEIDNLSGSKRKRKLKSFIKKYGYDIDGDYESIFAKVKNLLLPQEQAESAN